MLRKAKPSKPEKPFKDFPLTAHPNGQWAKKIRGRIHYFGKWDNWEAALEEYGHKKDALHLGQSPKIVGATMGDLLNSFLYGKTQLVETGELSQRSYLDYQATCDRIAASIQKSMPIDSLQPAQFDKLRADLAKGKRGKRGPTTLKNDLNRARMVFLHASEAGLTDRALLFRKGLKTPKAKEFRKLANNRGPRMFDPQQINALIGKASPQVKAMILLGINCGFGNNDCATLPQSELDLARGWHTYARPKTGNARRCPLWLETVAALKDSIEVRPEPKNPEHADLVFVTEYGNSWASDPTNRDNPLSAEFRKLLKEVKAYRKGNGFYSLRRTLETIGATCGEQIAVNYIMGHCAEANDMASVYRQKQFDAPLLKVTKHVHDWLTGKISIA